MSSIRLSARLGAAIAALATPFVLVACGGAAQPAAPAPAGAQASAEHNDADIQFAQTMIPHHQQALEMAGLATDRATSPEVKELATQIRSAHDPEIVTLTGFLETWGAEAPAAGSMGGMGGMGGMDHSGMSGMVTAEQIEQLSAATGPAFDTMFLQLVAAHHEGAIADAQRELAEGVNLEAKALATRIVEAQTAENTRVQQLLRSS